MIDWTTTYLGLKLANPLVVSASPLAEDLDTARRLEDAGAAAIVMPSLFEEQIVREARDLDRMLDSHAESFPEATSYFPDLSGYNFGPDGYLDHLRRLKETLAIPIIGSLNGVTPGGWARHARLMQDAGAAAIELNLYTVPTDPNVNGAELERQYIDLVRQAAAAVVVPVAVKVSPFLTAPVAFARELAAAGAEGLVLFNRFYQPDFDLERMEVVPRLKLSRPDELLLRLHWTAIISGQVEIDLAVTGGIHDGIGALKTLLAGASVAMMTSALMMHGTDRLTTVLQEMQTWMEEHEYESVTQMRGAMNLRSVADPAAFERANYMKVLRQGSMFAPPW